MPVVPRATLQTETAPLPGQRLSADAPAAAFGGVQPVDLGGAAGVVKTIWEDNKQKGDQIAVMDADSQSSKFETDLLYNPQTGLLNKRGKDALGITETASAAWEKHVSEIEKGLANDDQRYAFRKMSLQRGDDLNTAVQRHVSGELRTYDETKTKEYVAGEQDAAVINFQDPKRVALSVARQQDALRLFAQRNGLPQEWIDTHVADAASKTHTSIVNRILANGEDQRASEYYGRIKDQIVGADTIAVEKALDEGSTRGEAQRQTDVIIAGSQNRAEALAKAKLIKDPKVRDASEQRVNQHYNEVRAIERETQDQLYLTATNIIDGRPGQPARAVVPPNIWTKLDLNQREALERRSEGGNGPNDNSRWLDFLDLHPIDLGKMTKAEFEAKYWGHFDGPHRERAALQWAAARDAVSKGLYKQPSLVATITFKDRLENTLKTSKLIDNKPLKNLSKDQQLSYAELETEAAHRIEEYELSKLGGKRRATGDEMQAIIDEMTAKRVFIDKNWIRSDPEKVASLVTADEKGKAYVPYDKVPPSSRASIERILKSNGRRITRDIIQRAYAATVMDDYKMFNDIIGGAGPALPAPVNPPIAPPLR